MNPTVGGIKMSNMWKKGHNSRNCCKNMKCTKCGKNGHDDQNCWSEIICGKCVSTDHPKKWFKNNSPLNFYSSKKFNYYGKRGHSEEYWKENIGEDKF